jgi:hypothetical protein
MVRTLAKHWREKLRDGSQVLIRPIHKEDGALERAVRIGYMYTRWRI